eukprot:COSAG06_NODE_32239_length_509_cov_0.870732_2_plen_65_part_01
MSEMRGSEMRGVRVVLTNTSVRLRVRRNRKQFYSVNAQCVVAADRTVLSLSAVTVGASHDATAWA